MSFRPFLLILAAFVGLTLWVGVPQSDARQDRYVGKRYVTEATAYSPCDGWVGQGTMAYGRQVYLGAVASNWLPAKTKVKLEKPIRISGKLRRYFIVEDTGANFDIWMPSCSEMNNFGRRTIAFRIVHRRPVR